MIDHVMRFNLSAAIEKMAELAQAVGAAAEGVLPEARAEAFIDWLAALKADLSIPATLSHYTAKRPVTRADIAALVDVAINDTCHQTNPRPCTREDFERIFTAAM
jgi:alcohol dehydrogenase class IV